MLSVLDNHDIFILALSLEAKTSQEETSQNYNTLKIGRMDATNPGLKKGIWGIKSLNFQAGYHLQSIILKVFTSSSSPKATIHKKVWSKCRIIHQSGKNHNSKRKDWKYMEIGLYVIFVARFITKPPHWFEEK